MNIKQQEVKFSLKEKAIIFLKLIVTGKIKDAYEAYIDHNFYHHNPFFRGDASSLMQAMEEDALLHPHKTLEIIHALEEDDTVVIHSHVKKNPDDIGWIIIHIYRFKENKIIELWDISQPVPENCVNQYGIF